jgi:polysaccharide export outer membrane protein
MSGRRWRSVATRRWATYGCRARTPCRHGGTAQSAVALAGGFGPGEVLRRTAVSEYLQAEEHVRRLNAQKRMLLVRKARLEAQRDGLDTFSPPDLGDVTNDKDTIEIVANEQDVLRAQAAILQGEIDLLRSQKPCSRSRSMPTANRVMPERSSST